MINDKKMIILQHQKHVNQLARLALNLEGELNDSIKTGQVISSKDIGTT